MHGIRAGRLREEVAIKTATETADAYGQAVKTFTTRETVRAEVRQLSGTENENAGQYNQQGIYQFTMRDTTLTVADRLTWNSLDFEIFEIIERLHRGRVLTVKAGRV